MQNADYKDSAHLDVQGLSKGDRETSRLRLFFLAPLTLMIMVAVGLLVFLFYSHEQDELRNRVLRVQASAMDLYQDSIRIHARPCKPSLKY